MTLAENISRYQECLELYDKYVDLCRKNLSMSKYTRDILGNLDMTMVYLQQAEHYRDLAKECLQEAEKIILNESLETIIGS